MAKKGNSEEAAATQMSLREQLLGRLSDEEDSMGKREISVMARMSSEIVEVLDALVELNIFSSRSEAVSAFVSQSISARKTLFEEIRKQAAEIQNLRDSAKKHAFEVFHETE